MIRRITAKYPGTCQDCGKAIVIGQSIRWAREFTAHVDCQAAARQADGCPACSGCGYQWPNTPCRSCDGTGSREVYEFAKSGGHPRKDGATC